MKTAFTLIEILIVVILLAILAAIVVPNFMDFTDTTNASKAAQDERSLNSAWQMLCAKASEQGSTIDVTTGVDYASAILLLTGNGLIKEEPTAPEGYTYSVTGTGTSLVFECD